MAYGKQNLTDDKVGSLRKPGNFWSRLLGKPQKMRSAYDIARENGDEGTTVDYCGGSSGRSDLASSVTPLFGMCPYTGGAKKRRN